MEMKFGKAHDIWGRVVSGDDTLSDDEVKAAAEWFDEFSGKLSDKASQSAQALEDAIQRHENDDAIIQKYYFLPEYARALRFLIYQE